MGPCGGADGPAGPLPARGGAARRRGRGARAEEGAAGPWAGRLHKGPPRCAVRAGCRRRCACCASTAATAAARTTSPRPQPPRGRPRQARAAAATAASCRGWTAAAGGRAAVRVGPCVAGVRRGADVWASWGLGKGRVLCTATWSAVPTPRPSPALPVAVLRGPRRRRRRRRVRGPRRPGRPGGAGGAWRGGGAGEGGWRAPG